MFKKIAVLTGLLTALSACTTPQVPTPHALMTAPSPISADGNVADRATDEVFALVLDASPQIAGLSLRVGESLRLALPAAFRRNADAAVSADNDRNLVLTKGWPQGAVKLAGQYRIGFDATTHSMVVTALQDIAADAANAPGIKVIHLRGRSFLNPMPGEYAVALTHVAANGTVLASWQGQVKVLDKTPAARLAPTNFHLPPGANADFQRVAPGQVAPLNLGLLLWGEGGKALNGVGIAPRDLNRFPRYTGGLLVQDSNHDHRLDPATDKVVGGIIGAAPQGAKGQAASSPIGNDGLPVLSGEVQRDAGFGAAAGGGKPNPGLLPIQFRVGDKPGLYRPTVELIGGNSYQFTIEVVAP